MKRRNFLEVSSAGAAAFLSGLKPAGADVSPTAAQAPAFTPHAPLPVEETALAPFSLAALRQIKRQYEYDIYEDFLPFMDKFVVDHELGSFMCTVDRDGTRLSTDKSAWFTGRGIWVYSFLYNNLTHDPKHLEVARQAVDFILKSKPKGDALWPSAFTREGEPKGLPDARTYSDIFIASGLAEYAAASGEPRFRDMAIEILLKCQRVYDWPDFCPEIVNDYKIPGAPLVPGARVQGVWFTTLSLATTLLSHHPDAQVEAIADRCLDAVMNRHFNPEYGLNNEILEHDLSRPRNDLARFVYTGHCIETLWMVMDEAVRRKDRALFERAAARLRRAIEVAWDDVYGGVFRSLNDAEANVWFTDKVLWAQEEVLIGTLMIAEHAGSAWAREWFVKMYNYIHDKWPLAKHGYPLWDNGTDRKVTFVPHSNRIENFHHPRHLMLNLLASTRLLDRGGRVSGVFI
ncbi:MAG: AGE family epimerase/isomerase [Candidatus Aminicenantes bacterium]|nr:AGE family epimerase/isomerase [Candidatus Aminicenantes bacterium]